jgi:alcohol dehydrogenase (cytochrome c)
VDWTNGLDEKGRPIPMPTSDVSRAGRLIRPGVAGATNWQNAAFDARLGLVFIPATEGASVFTKAAQPRRGDRGTLLGSAGSLRYPVISAVRAVDAATGANRWERVAPSSRTGFPTYGGLLATGGGLVFGATGGYVFALDAASGKELWRVPLGGETLAAPISFTVEGGQVIAVSAGRAMFVFGL